MRVLETLRRADGDSKTICWQTCAERPKVQSVATNNRINTSECHPRV